MKYTLSQAAQVTGIDESIIWKHMRRGWLFASKNEKGEYVIAAEDLFMVFPQKELTEAPLRENPPRLPEPGRQTPEKVKITEFEHYFPKIQPQITNEILNTPEKPDKKPAQKHHRKTIITKNERLQLGQKIAIVLSLLILTVILYGVSTRSTEHLESLTIISEIKQALQAFVSH